jgi:hypothetical protein
MVVITDEWQDSIGELRASNFNRLFFYVPIQGAVISRNFFTETKARANPPPFSLRLKQGEGFTRADGKVCGGL